MSTQWREGGMDYAALHVTAGLLGIRLSPQRFAELRFLENEALRVLGERRKKVQKSA